MTFSVESSSKTLAPSSLAPGFTTFAPHIGEELWQRLGHGDSLAYAGWPAFDPALAREDTMTYAVQVNGKVRGQVELPLDAQKDAALAAARALENVARHLEGKTLRKEIFVPRRLINFVVS